MKLEDKIEEEMIINLIIVSCIFIKASQSVPGFEFGDNRAAKYLTDDNGVAEITFQEGIQFKFNFFINHFNYS